MDGYRVRWSLNPDIKGPPIDIGNKTSYEIVGLERGVQYYVSITAYKGVQESTPLLSSPIFVPLKPTD